MFFLFSLLFTAQAGIDLNVEKMEINGLPIRTLNCTLHRDLIMAALQIGTALATAKENIELDHPITWTVI